MIHRLLPLIVLLVSIAEPARSAEPLNVLFIVVDDLRPQLGCYGDPMAQTPNIDRLANEGTAFSRAYCQEAVCNPSRQSVLTGQRPDSIQVWNLKEHFRDTKPDAVTLPRYFKEHGYYTQGIGKIYHGAANMGDPSGWTVPPQYEITGPGTYARPENQPPPGKLWFKRGATEAADVDDGFYIDAMVADAAIEVMEAQKNKPFFLAVGFRRPHLPFTAPQRYWDLYDREAMPTPTPENAPEGAPDVSFHDWGELRSYDGIPKKGAFSEALTKELWHGYFAAVSYMDAQVGRLLDTLDRLNLREHTVVVLWGDNGFHLGEQAMWCKATNYEFATRVPFIISDPGFKAGNSDALVELLDIYPTLVDLCELPPSEDLEGTSLRELLLDPSQTDARSGALSQFPRPWNTGDWGKQPQIMGYTLRTDQWRYIEWIDLKDDTIIERELYDMSRGEPEQRNLASEASSDPIMETLSRQLHEVRASGKPSSR